MTNLIAFIIICVFFIFTIINEIRVIKKADSYFWMVYRNISGLIMIIISLTILRNSTKLMVLYCLNGVINILLTTYKIRKYV